MKTRFHVLALASIVLALAATQASAAPLLGDASLVCAQTPADAAIDASNGQITPDDPNPGNLACGSLCQKWVRTCKGAIKAMKACWLSAVGKIGALRNAACNQLADSATKENCRAVVATEKDAAKTFLANSSEAGRLFCEAGGLANCIANCS